MRETDPDRRKYYREMGKPSPIDAQTRLDVSRELQVEEEQRQERIRNTIQEILAQGPMIGIDLFKTLKERIPNVTNVEFFNARLLLGYRNDQRETFTFKPQ